MLISQKKHKHFCCYRGFSLAAPNFKSPYGTNLEDDGKLKIMSKIIPVTSDGEEAYRRELRVWMRQVLSTKRLSAESWAREAGIAGTTVRRFLNGGPEAPTPSLDTIGTLSRIAGFGPNLSFASALSRVKPSAADVRLIEHDLAAKLTTRANYHDMLAQLKQYPVISVDEGSCSVFAYAVEVEHAAVNQLGVLVGDIVLVEPVWALQPQANDLVLTEDLSQVMVLTYYPPFAMPRSTDLTYEPRQLDDVTILGTVVELRRRTLHR